MRRVIQVGTHAVNEMADWLVDQQRQARRSGSQNSSGAALRPATLPRNEKRERDKRDQDPGKVIREELEKVIRERTAAQSVDGFVKAVIHLAERISAHSTDSFIEDSPLGLRRPPGAGPLPGPAAAGRSPLRPPALPSTRTPPARCAGTVVPAPA